MQTKKLFHGEIMDCSLCSKQQPSSPTVSSHWRAIEIGDHVFYACPDHFPPDGAPEKAFKEAYDKWFKLIYPRSLHT